MKHPDIAAVPPAAVRQSINSQEWIGILESWTAIIDLYARLNDQELVVVCKSTRLANFLKGFYYERALSSTNDSTLRSLKATALARRCSELVAKCHGVGQLRLLLLDLTFLQSFAKCHAKSPSVRELLTKIWNSFHTELSVELRKWQVYMLTLLESVDTDLSFSNLEEIAPLAYSCPSMAASLLTGTDFLEAANVCYTKTSLDRLRHVLVLVVYLSLLGLINVERPNPALLSDHLYSLKAYTDSQNSSRTILPDLVTDTPLLKRIDQYTQASKHERLDKIAQGLRAYQVVSTARMTKRRHVQRSKGKQKAGVDHELHVHRMSLVTQLQDLFPDLGAGFILRLLDAYHDNVEEVTAQLLEDNLPFELLKLDKQEEAPVFDVDRAHAVDHLAPRSTPTPPDLFIPERTNAFDNDAFDRLEIDTSKLHVGKREHTVADGQTNKAAILAALAAFDSDDDERDDTYDVEDVGGMVDTAHHDGDDSISASLDENDIKLYKHYEASPNAFGRTADIRRSSGRAALKQKTGMTDEAIEGWAIMLQRDPKRARKLAFEASRFDGGQIDIARTAYREGLDTETEDSDTLGRSYATRGRGRGRGGGPGRGDNVSSPTSEPSTAAAKRRKEANKSSRANHNRRDQRARKMARGGFPGVS